MAKLKNLRIQDGLAMAFGSYRKFAGFSKRLSPAMTIHNAAISANGVKVMDADVIVPKYYRQLKMVGEIFDVEIKIHYESDAWGAKNLSKTRFLWTSKDPDNWYGYCVDIDGNEIQAPAPLSDVLPYYEKDAEDHRKQWMIDHGLVKVRKKRKLKKQAK